MLNDLCVPGSQEKGCLDVQSTEHLQPRFSHEAADMDNVAKSTKGLNSQVYIRKQV